jgi:hypothetical protein
MLGGFKQSWASLLLISLETFLDTDCIKRKSGQY